MHSPATSQHSYFGTTQPNAQASKRMIRSLATRAKHDRVARGLLSSDAFASHLLRAVLTLGVGDVPLKKESRMKLRQLYVMRTARIQPPRYVELAPPDVCS
eukprot:6195107-Pleurochrysis_carterae.AAC.4